MSDHARKVLIKDLIANYSEGESSSSSSSSAAAELVAVAGGEESERASATATVAVTATATPAANPQVANVKVPCTGGVDGLIENVLKKCTEELGAPFDPCGGKTKKAIIDASAKIKFEEGGVLADY